MRQPRTRRAGFFHIRQSVANRNQLPNANESACLCVLLALWPVVRRYAIYLRFTLSSEQMPKVCLAKLPRPPHYGHKAISGASPPDTTSITVGKHMRTNAVLVAEGGAIVDTHWERSNLNLQVRGLVWVGWRMLVLVGPAGRSC